MRSYSQLTFVSYLVGPVQMIFFHIGSFLVLWTGLSWGAVAWIVGLYLIRMFATTGIYHRLLTHRSYQAPVWFLRLGCVVAASAGQMGPSWWKSHHLSHHRYADQAPDPHSPYAPAQGEMGFYWSQLGWLLTSRCIPTQLPADVEKDPILKMIDRLHFIPWIALMALSYGIGGLEYLSAFFLSTTLLFHGVQTVNSLSHIIGTQPFQTDDQSRNNRFVALITLGEGWHNLHHAFQSSSRHGITIRTGKVAYLPDPTYRLIKVLEFFKLASKLRVPTEDDLLVRARI